MRIERLAIERLNPAPYNPRHALQPGDDEYEKLQRSLAEFGLVEPLVWNERTGNLVGGHQRLAILRAQGVTEVEVSVVDLDPDRERLLNIALNRIQGEWDDHKLALLLAELGEAGADTSLTGFDPDDIERIIARAGVDVPSGDEEDEPVLPVDPVTRPGDVIILGRHRLLCGDATDAAAVAALLGGARVDLLVTSPPYNVGIKYRSYDDRPADRDDYLAFIRAVADAWVPQLNPGRFVAWNVGISPQTHHFRQAVVLEECGLRYHRQIVWVKQGVPIPTFHMTIDNPRARAYHPDWRHEIIAVFAAGEPAAVRWEPAWEHDLVYLFENGPVERGARISLPNAGSSDVWDFIHQVMASNELPDATEGTEHHSNLDTRAVKAHPAAFPVRLPQTLIAYLTAPGEVVADPFGGSGSTILAAEKMDRVCYATEMDPSYCDLAAARWERLTGQKAERVRQEEIGDVGPRGTTAAVSG